MLKQLRVKNFALIDEAALIFGPGLNVLTGETGAGKSILMEALGFALGNRLESEWLRPGRVLSVEAVFEIPARSASEKALGEKGVRLDDEVLNIRREAEAAGKTRSFLNGAMVSGSQLKEIAGFLVDIFGQRDGESLYEREEQSELLDVLAGISEEVKKFDSLYRRRGELLQSKHSLMDSLAQKERECDLLRYQVKEIEAARIEPHEDERLQESRLRLGSAEKLGTLFREADQLLYNGDPSAFEFLGRLTRSLQSLAKTDPGPETEALFKEAESLEVRAGELTRLLTKYGDSLESDPAKLERVLERIDCLDRLKKKYGKTLEEVFSFLAESKKRLDFLESSEENLKNFDQEIEALERSMELEARGLTHERQRAAKSIEKAVNRELDSLEMKGARFEVRIETGDFNPRGKDRSEFFLSANAGEDLKPLAKVASGGEASRIQLALKKCFAEAQAVTTLIFDEIDSGIGARLAPVIGEKLEALAQGRTVIAITHLAPVASRARTHWQALKKAGRQRTAVEFEKLEGDSRVREIAKMLSGKKVTDTSLKHAEEILRS